MGSGISKSKQSLNSHGDSKTKKTLIKVLNGHTGGINCFDVSSINTVLLTGSDDRTARIWDLNTFDCKVVLEGHVGYISCCKIWEDRYALTGSVDKTIRKWNVVSGNCVLKMEQHAGIVNRMLLFGSFMFTTSYDRTTVCWNIATGQPARVFRGHKQGVLPILYYHTSEHDPLGASDVDRNRDAIITGSMDHTAKMWSIQSGTLLQTFKGHKGAVLCMAFDNEKKAMFTGSTDFTIKKWNLTDASLLKTFKGHEASVLCLQISHKLLYSASVDCTARCWVAEFGDTTRKYTGHEHMISDMKYHSGFVITGSGDNTVRVFDAKSGSLKRTFKGHKYVVNCILAYNDRILSGSYDGTVRIWNIHDLLVDKLAESEGASSSSLISSAPSLDLERVQMNSHTQPMMTYSENTITEENEFMHNHKRKHRHKVTPSVSVPVNGNNHNSEPIGNNFIVSDEVETKSHRKARTHQVVPVSVHHNSNNNNNFTDIEQYDEAAKGLDELLATEEISEDSRSEKLNSTSPVSTTTVSLIEEEISKNNSFIENNINSTNISQSPTKTKSISSSNSSKCSTPYKTQRNGSIPTNNPGNRRPQSKMNGIKGKPDSSATSRTSNTSSSLSLSVSLPSDTQTPTDTRIPAMLAILKEGSDVTEQNEQRELSDVSRKRIKTVGKSESITDVELVDEEMRMIAMETASNSTGYHSDKSSPQSPKQSLKNVRRFNNKVSSNSSIYTNNKSRAVPKTSRKNMWEASKT